MLKFNWGTGIFLFFVVFVGLMITFVIFSLKQNNDLVSDDYYQQGAQYTKHMEVQSRSLLYKDSIGFKNEADKIEIQVCSSLAKNIDSMRIYFFRPSNKKYDFTQMINPKEKTCLIERSKLAKGHYQARISWAFKKDSYLIIKELDVQ